MIISKTPIEHIIKHPEPIFTIDRNSTHFATGGLNGELKIWDSSYRHIRTVKKHVGSVSSARFSRDGQLLASAGDDGFVYVYSTSDYEAPIHTIKHPIDVTNVEWGGNFIVTADLDGNIFISTFNSTPENNISRFFTNRTVSFNLLKKLKTKKSITGLAVSPNSQLICIYTEGVVKMYKNFEFVSKFNTEKCVIVESLNSRLSFSPCSKYVSVGLQFNRKNPTVDVFNSSLEREFSLFGHVSPSEITSFNPNKFKAIINQSVNNSANNIDNNTNINVKNNIDDTKNNVDNGANINVNNNSTNSANINVNKNTDNSANINVKNNIDNSTNDFKNGSNEINIVINDSENKKSCSDKYAVLAVASQDLSISFWSTANPKPFLLIKNFTEAPVLDMVWDNLTLYACSFDGVVKKIEFSSEDLGRVADAESDEEEMGLPFSKTNMQLRESKKARTESFKVQKRKLPEMGDFKINNKKLSLILNEDIINNKSSILLNSKELKEISQELKSTPVKEKGLKIAIKEAVRNTGKSAIPNTKTVSVSDLPKESDENFNKIAVNEESNKVAVSTEIINKPVIKDEEYNKIAVKDDVLKPKRITPTLVNGSNAPVSTANIAESSVVLFNTNIPDKLKINKNNMVNYAFGEIAVEVGESSVKAKRNSREIYTLSGNFNIICCNKKYLVTIGKHIQVYGLESGLLLLPYITMKVAFADLLEDRLLVLDTTGEFKILNLGNSSNSKRLGFGSVEYGKMPKTKGLMKIQLNKMYYLVAQYEEKEFIYYNKEAKMWFALNADFCSVLSGDGGDRDDTLMEMELELMNYVFVGDTENTENVCRRIVRFVVNMEKINDFIEYKIERIFSVLGAGETALGLLEELNEKEGMARLVERLHHQLFTNEQ
ncbi:hypothetical protein ENBRE01_0566 [Enteropsectra breve]|nr:hypothetical protein ENBRE01_0566 [Enteropsectra breve]